MMLNRYPDVITKILIIDLDVHQGNGNAKLFQGRDDVLTFSMHCKVCLCFCLCKVGSV